MLSLTQLAAIKIESKTNSQIGKPGEKIKRQELIAVGVREDAEETLDFTTFIDQSLQKLPLRFKQASQFGQKRDQVFIFLGAKGI